MSDAQLIEMLEDEEDTVLHAYQDHMGFWTIGTGRLIDKRKGGGITREESRYLLQNDINRINAELDKRLPWWRGLDPVRQRVLQGMAFQMGVTGLLGFKGTLAHAKAGRWAQAAAGMLASKWAREDTPARAKRMADMMRSGVA